jgi:hypothetical protein
MKCLQKNDESLDQVSDSIQTGRPDRERLEQLEATLLDGRILTRFTLSGRGIYIIMLGYDGMTHWPSG